MFYKGLWFFVLIFICFKDETLAVPSIQDPKLTVITGLEDVGGNGDKKNEWYDDCLEKEAKAKLAAKRFFTAIGLVRKPEETQLHFRKVMANESELNVPKSLFKTAVKHPKILKLEKSRPFRALDHNWLLDLLRSKNKKNIAQNYSTERKHNYSDRTTTVPTLARRKCEPKSQPLKQVEFLREFYKNNKNYDWNALKKIIPLTRNSRAELIK